WMRLAKQPASTSARSIAPRSKGWAMAPSKTTKRTAARLSMSSSRSPSQRPPPASLQPHSAQPWPPSWNRSAAKRGPQSQEVLHGNTMPDLRIDARGHQDAGASRLSTAGNARRLLGGLLGDARAEQHAPKPQYRRYVSD